MNLQIGPIKTPSFAAVDSKNKKQSAKDNNPISTNGERALLASATFIGGLGVGARAMFYLWEEGFSFETIINKGKKIVDKSNIPSEKRILGYVVASAGLIAAAIGGIALLYTAYNAPKISYEGKVNAFKKGKDMDAYIKGNKAETQLYDQIKNKADVASVEEKSELMGQYMKMQIAKNQVPDSVKR